ncbi:hypothetical protein ACFWZY_16940 [Streptomyces sp. NPDC058992]|uniref:hypothetical protein n=1 Tax=Streptomyces sp. NPDC058992 TaxID=3346688 RepID=UPI0036A61274
MPPELARFNPDDWAEDPGDPVDRYYFGRHRWMEAREAWHRRQVARMWKHSA